MTARSTDHEPAVKPDRASQATELLSPVELLNGSITLHHRALSTTLSGNSRPDYTSMLASEHRSELKLYTLTAHISLIKQYELCSYTNDKTYLICQVRHTWQDGGKAPR